MEYYYYITACIDTFQEFVDTLSYEGELVYQAVSKEECEDICLADATCLAYDYNGERSICFLHRDGYLNDVVAGVAATGVNQYRRQDCEVPAETFPTIDPSMTFFSILTLTLTIDTYYLW